MIKTNGAGETGDKHVPHYIGIVRWDVNYAKYIFSVMNMW